MKRICKLVPVIEISPWTQEKDIKIVGDEDYQEFKARILLEYGCSFTNENFKSIEIDQITDNDLKGIVKIELDESSDDIYSFDGGIILVLEDDKSINHSTGTGMISDYQNWLKFITIKPNSWEEIWIGRPWIYGRVRGNIIQLSDYHDETKPKLGGGNDGICYEFELDNFEIELCKGIAKIKRFEQRIEKVIRQNNTNSSNEIASLLINGNKNATNKPDSDHS